MLNNIIKFFGVLYKKRLKTEYLKTKAPGTHEKSKKILQEKYFKC